MPRKRARPVREGVVGKGAPTQSHLAGDLLHITSGSGGDRQEKDWQPPAPRPTVYLTSAHSRHATPSTPDHSGPAHQPDLTQRDRRRAGPRRDRNPSSPWHW